MSWQLVVLRRWLRWSVRPLVARMHSIPAARRSFRLAAQIGFRRVPGVTYREAEGAFGPGLWALARGAAQPGIVVYFHGGAYVVGSPRTYSELAGRLAVLSQRRVYLPSYPLAPEHPAPAAFEAGMEVWRTLRSEGYAAANIVLAGDSAGGGMALAVLAQVLQDGERPAACVTFAPWTDMTLSGASLTENATTDLTIPRARLVEVRDMVVGELSKKDPRISPLYADYPDCPPVFVSWAESELLRDDSVRLVASLRDRGIAVETDILPDAPHVWQLFQGQLPEADASLTAAAAFLTRALSPSPASGS